MRIICVARLAAARRMHNAWWKERGWNAPRGSRGGGGGATKGIIVYNEILQLWCLKRRVRFVWAREKIWSRTGILNEDWVENDRSVIFIPNSCCYLNYWIFFETRERRKICEKERIICSRRKYNWRNEEEERMERKNIGEKGFPATIECTYTLVSTINFA